MDFEEWSYCDFKLMLYFLILNMHTELNYVYVSVPVFFSQGCGSGLILSGSGSRLWKKPDPIIFRKRIRPYFKNMTLSSKKLKSESWSEHLILNLSQIVFFHDYFLSKHIIFVDSISFFSLYLDSSDFTVSLSRYIFLYRLYFFSVYVLNFSSLWSDITIYFPVSKSAESLSVKEKEWSYFIKGNDSRKGSILYVVLIFDGNLEHVVHAWRIIGFFWDKIRLVLLSI